MFFTGLVNLLLTPIILAINLILTPFFLLIELLIGGIGVF